VRLLDAHHGSKPTSSAMAWQNRQAQSQNASAPWRNKEQGRWSRKPAKRQPTWEEIRDLTSRIDAFTTQPDNKPAKEADADKARLVSLKRMRAEAANLEDQEYLDTKINELSSRIARQLPLHDRLKIAKEKCEAADQRVQRNQVHLDRARLSSEKASAHLAECRRELEQIQAEVSADGHGGQQAQQRATSQALEQAAGALQYMVTLAMQNRGTVTFTADLLADVGNILDAMPRGSGPAPRTPNGPSAPRTPTGNHAQEPYLSPYEEDEEELISDVEFASEVEEPPSPARGRAPTTPSAGGVTPGQGTPAAARKAALGETKTEQTQNQRQQPMAPFSRVSRRARVDPYDLNTPKKPRRTRTRSA